MDPIDELKEKQILLAGWLSDYKVRSDQVPYVQRSLDIVNFQIDAVSQMPPSVPDAVRSEIMTGFSNAVPFWGSFMHAFPTHAVTEQAISGLAIETTGANAAYQAMSAVTVGYTQEIAEWAREKTMEYQAIQKRQDRVGAIRELITRSFPHRLAELEAATATFARSVSGAEPQASWGIHARNLLEHIKGDLFAAAQKAQGKQRVKWSEFADALARGGVGSREHDSLLREEATNRVLHSSLTDLAKNLVRLPVLDLRDRQTELDDHLFSVLTLIDEQLYRKFA